MALYCCQDVIKVLVSLILPLFYNCTFIWQTSLSDVTHNKYIKHKRDNGKMLLLG